MIFKQQAARRADHRTDVSRRTLSQCVSDDRVRPEVPTPFSLTLMRADVEVGGSDARTLC